MTDTHFDVIVVGAGGAMGSSTCFELARRGVRLLGLDQAGIAHGVGSSHGLSRMIRLAYYEHPDYVPLLRRAYERWRELEALSNQRILEMTGAIYAGPAGCELVEGSRASATQHGIAHEMLDRQEIAHRFPLLSLPDDHVGLFEPAGGFVYPERAITAYADLATRAGATLRPHEALRAWTSNSVTTDLTTYTCDSLVLCGGAWTSAIVRDLGIGLRVTRQVMGWSVPGDPAPFAIGRFPCWAVQQPDGSLYYGFPITDGAPGVKVAHHKPGPVIEPGQAREWTQEDVESIRAIVKQVVPGARGAVSVRLCMYTNSPDQHFIIGPHPHHPSVILACGFSGHGFKFASVVGEVLADLALDGRTKWPVGFLSPTRFGRPGSAQ